MSRQGSGRVGRSSQRAVVLSPGPIVAPQVHIPHVTGRRRVGHRFRVAPLTLVLTGSVGRNTGLELPLVPWSEAPGQMTLPLVTEPPSSRTPVRVNGGLP